MQPIQYILLALILVFVIRRARRYSQKKIHLNDFLLSIFFWSVPAIFIIRPSLAQFLAELVGIGRGADLVLYVGMVILFALFFMLLSDQKQIERKVTQLGREIAKREALDNTKKSEQ